jgi:hypothetical protein
LGDPDVNSMAEDGSSAAANLDHAIVATFQQVLSWGKLTRACNLGPRRRTVLAIRLETAGDEEVPCLQQRQHEACGIGGAFILA